MSQDSLPTLSLPLLDRLREQSDHHLQLPPPPLLHSPETILQLGWGKFLRGFTPDFVQSANVDGRYSGRILAVQREGDWRSQASECQNALYTLILRGTQHGMANEVKRVIGSVSRLLIANRDWDGIVAAVRKRELRVILSNATETGLRLDPEDRLESAPPHSFIGKLSRLLFERWRSTGGRDADVAVIPTELVENNGTLVHRLLLEQAQAWKLGSGFLDWARNSVHVASTLVDRIVVGTPRAELLAAECQALGYQDDLVTCGEPFYLFAITADEFITQHFPIHLACPNVRFVDDLAPYRRRKLRILNGPQMVLSTLGLLLGFRIIRQAVEDPQVGPFTRHTVFQEIIPAMGSEQEDFNLKYANECLERIGNPHIEHRLQGISVDLTTKNAIRLFPSIRDFLARRGELPGRLLLTVAAMLEVALREELQDAHAEFIKRCWQQVGSPSTGSRAAFARVVLGRLSEASGELLDVDRVAPAVADLLAQIREKGLRTVLTRRYSAKFSTPSDSWTSS
jgi:tagaturonate reductase